MLRFAEREGLLLANKKHITHCCSTSNSSFFAMRLEKLLMAHIGGASGCKEGLSFDSPKVLSLAFHYRRRTPYKTSSLGFK
jgi:hypothetical protein